MKKKQTNPNSLKNLKRGNPETELKKGDPRTKKIASMGGNAAKAVRSFRETYLDMIKQSPELQIGILDALQEKAQNGDVQAIRLVMDLLGEMKVQVDMQSDNKIEFVVGDLKDYAN